LGLLVALFALAMQLSAASTVPFAGLPATGLDKFVAASICHSGAAADDHGGPPAQHHAPDCAVCPLCQAIAHAGVLLAAPLSGFAVPLTLVARTFELLPARAPPGRRATATSARGPPATL